MDLAVSTTGLRREFRSRVRGGAPTIALHGVDLAVDRGEIRGLLGPNGAGKTTLVKILTTILTPTAGLASVLGHDVVTDTEEVRRRIGLVFGGDRGLYTLLSGRQNLEYWAALYGVPRDETRRRVSDLLARVGLADRADDRVEIYSRGMRQRLHLARGLISDPDVLFFDEPTVGLDPVAALAFRDLVLELRGEGKTIFLTTHDMHEAETVCDRVTLIDRGAILATETPATLGTWITSFSRIEAHDVPDGDVSRIEAMPGVASVEHLPDRSIRISLSAEGSVRAVVESLLAAGVTNFGASPPRLEEVYVTVFGARGLEV